MAGLPKERNVLFMGFRTLGESSQIIQFVDNYEPTLENTFSRNISVSGQEFSLQVVDTAGQDEYSLIIPSFMDINGYVIVCSVNSEKSFRVAQVVYSKLKDMMGDMGPEERVPVTGTNLCALVVRVGRNLMSLLTPNENNFAEVMITYEEGKRLADSWNAPFLEASAMENSVPKGPPPPHPQLEAVPDEASQKMKQQSQQQMAWVLTDFCMAITCHEMTSQIDVLYNAASRHEPAQRQHGVNQNVNDCRSEAAFHHEIVQQHGVNQNVDCRSKAAFHHEILQQQPVNQNVNDCRSEAAFHHEIVQRQPVNQNVNDCRSLAAFHHEIVQRQPVDQNVNDRRSEAVSQRVTAHWQPVIQNNPGNELEHLGFDVLHVGVQIVLDILDTPEPNNVGAGIAPALEFQDLGVNMARAVLVGHTPAPEQNVVVVPPGVDSGEQEQDDPQAPELEYEEDVAEHMMEMEYRVQLPAYFLSNSPQVTSWNRAKLVDWLTQVQASLGLKDEGLQLGVVLIDLSLMKSPQALVPHQLPLLGISCLYLATKFVDNRSTIDDLLPRLCAVTFTGCQPSHVKAMEKHIMNVTGFFLGYPLPSFFLRRLLRLISNAARQERQMGERRRTLELHGAERWGNSSSTWRLVDVFKHDMNMWVERLASYLIDLSLAEMQFRSVAPSMLAASALCLARSVVFSSSMNPPGLGLTLELWPASLEESSGYRLSHLQPYFPLLARAMRANLQTDMEGAKLKHADLSTGNGVSVNPVFNNHQLQQWANYS